MNSYKKSKSGFTSAQDLHFSLISGPSSLDVPYGWGV